MIDFGAVLRRRKWELLGPMLLMLALSVAIAFGLPAVYRSTATILIEAQDIPQDFVPTMITSLADERLQVITQRVMTSNNLQQIIEQYDLYASDRAELPIEIILDRMQQDIIMERVSTEVPDRQSRNAPRTTIAFTVSYDSQSPEVAQRVANELASLYLNENARTRTELATETSDFLAEAVNELREQIAVLEARIADFKEQNAGKLPELAELNLQMVERTERELLEAERQIRALQERRIYLDSQVVQISPTAQLYSQSGKPVLGMPEQLQLLETEYVSRGAVYAPDHPDLVKLRRSIAALRQEVSGGVDRSQLEARLAVLSAELVAARQRYSEEHPDVRKLVASVEGVQAEIERAGSTPATSVAQPTNPAYIDLKAKLVAADTELGTWRAKRAELSTKLATLEERLIAMPQVEREYRVLLREHENAVAKFQEIQSKELAANLGRELEAERKGERFTLIEPPRLPQTPIKPNRLALLFLGVVLSFSGGVGTVAVVEAIDDSVRGRDGVRGLLGAPPLAVIPEIRSGPDTRRRTVRRVLTLVGAAGVAGGAAWLVNQHWMPLDTLWYALLQRAGL